MAQKTCCDACTDLTSYQSEMDIDPSDLYCRFNRIGYIDEQVLLSKQNTQLLLQLGKIFQKHQAIANFGITLIHRHLELLEGYAMVHSYQAPDKDFCLMEPIGNRKLFPRAYHLDADAFLPYEFALEPTLAPPADFLFELRSFLRDHNLHQSIGLVFVPSDEVLWLERPAANGSGTVATKAPRTLGALDGYTITEWIWREHGENIDTVVYRGCDPKEAGHVRT